MKSHSRRLRAGGSAVRTTSPHNLFDKEGFAHEKEIAGSSLDPDRDGDRHRDRLHDLHQLSGQEGRRADRRLHLDHVRRLPAADQDDHRARWCSPPWWSASPTWATRPRSGACSAKALGWFITASLVSLIARPGDGPTCCSRASTWACRCRTSAPSANLDDLQVHPQGLRHPPGAEVLRRGHGQQRDPADRRVLDVLRRRARRARRQGAKTLVAAIERALARHAEDHRLRDEARAAGRVRRHGRHRRRATGWRSCSSTPSSWATSTSSLFLLWGLLIARRLRCSSGPRVFKLLALIKRAVPAGLRHRQLGGRLSEDPGGAATASASSARSPASCCRWATRSTSTAR